MQSFSAASCFFEVRDFEDISHNFYAETALRRVLNGSERIDSVVKRLIFQWLGMVQDNCVEA